MTWRPFGSLLERAYPLGPTGGRANLRYLEIRYEHLIADPERTLREVCAFVDLPFDPRMLPSSAP